MFFLKEILSPFFHASSGMSPLGPFGPFFFGLSGDKQPGVGGRRSFGAYSANGGGYGLAVLSSRPLANPEMHLLRPHGHAVLVPRK